MPWFLDNVRPPAPNQIEPTLTFLTNELFDKIDGVSRNNLGKAKTITERKAQIINEFIQSFKLYIGNDMSPAAKLIFPEKAGRLYFIKEVALARLIIKMYRIPKDADDYNLLHYWNKQYQKSKRFAADEMKLRSLPLQVARVVAKRRDFTDQYKECTVSEINNLLDNLTLAKQSSEQVDLLKPLFDSLRIEEIRWLVQFILKKPILTNMEKYFFNSWHPCGYRLYSICNDLKKTFNSLADSEKELSREELAIHPRFKFKPQLAEKLTTNYDSVVKKLQKKQPMDENFENSFKQLDLENKFYIEEKTDGDRMLLHMENGNFKFYSRRLKDYSFLYGESFQFGSLTKYLNNAFQKKVDSVILDGEMVAYDYKRQIILPFGTLKSSAIQESVSQFTTIDQYNQQTSYPYYIIFDVLYLNGKELGNYPLFFRKTILSRIIKPVPHRFEISDARLGSTAADIEKSMREIVGNRSEGLVLKHTQSKYIIDGFRNPNWIKVKPEYLEKFGENLDLVVIGKNPGIKNSYMVGLKNTIDGAYYSFAMIGNGFEIEEFDKVERLTHGKWIDTGTRPPPENLIRFGRKRPAYWIEPKNSVVLEIKARSIDVRPEETYAVGSSLHNNFCRRIREDKSVDECITLQEYLDLKADYMRNISRSQTVAVKRKKYDVLTSFSDQGSDLKKVKAEFDLFSKFEFLIMSERRESKETVISAEELRALVKKYGGKVVHSIDSKSSLQVVIITEKDLPVGNKLLSQGFDLIKPNWIFECIKRNEIVQIEPCFIFATQVWPYYSKRVDKFGDSYTIHNSLSQVTVPHLEKSDLERLKCEFEWNELSKPLLYLFKHIKIHVMGTSLASRLLRERIERFAANTVDDYVNSGYIVIPFWEEQNNRHLTMIRLKKYYEKIDKELKIMDGRFVNKIPFTVTEGFINKSIEMNSIADAEDFKYY
ncbi:LIG4 [Candida oxycetoniae]|uniref:DNA ligase n=1 Tax=Candida oxycetoniae TaxID=497107 RepID=A0AAI9STE6_9ASCO|nr:LIG4 [Candida oxycetoniae]KAI3402357.2 LIG4 [Candida oxycetoniae]